MESTKKSSLWHNKDYLLLWGGQIISYTGSQISLLAFPLLVLALTHSPVQASITGVLRAIVYVLLILPVGALIDRWDRKRVMIFCDAIRALSLASIPIAFALGHLTIIQIYLVSTIEGTLFVFFDIAEVACLPSVVSKEQISLASAQNILTFNIAILLGPSLGGFLYSLGYALPFLTDTISYLFSVLFLFLIRSSFQGKRAISEKKNLRVDIKEGLLWLWRKPVVLSLGCLMGAGYFILSGLTLAIIILSQQMHASPWQQGFLIAAGGVGGIIGAMMTPLLQKHVQFRWIITGTTWLQALFLLFLPFAPGLLLVGLLLVGTNMAASIFDVTQRTHRMALIPDELQGRINSIYRLIIFGSQPIGLALTGIALQTLGSFATILLYGVGFIVIAVAILFNSHFRPSKTFLIGSESK